MKRQWLAVGVLCLSATLLSLIALPAAAWAEQEGAAPAVVPREAFYRGDAAPAATIAGTFEVELVVPHGPAFAVQLGLDNLSPERGWLLLEEPRGLVYMGPDGQLATHFRLRASPLATGGEVVGGTDGALRFEPAPTLPWPNIEVQVVAARGAFDGSDPDNVLERWPVPGFLVEVPSSLAPDATLPPAPKGLAALEAPAVVVRWYEDPRTFLAGGALAALLALAWWWRRLRRKSAAPQTRVQPTPRERVEQLLAKAPICPAPERRAVCFELAAALRKEVDTRLGQHRSALLEEEWLAALAKEPGAGEVATSLGALFSASASARWGRVEPSVYALEAQVTLARRAIAALDVMGLPREGERAA